MTLPRLEQMEEAARLIVSAMKPTPEICWATLSERCRAQVYVKHENHTPIGAFKIRGGLAYP
jgi:threonine dehydratase